jgi:ABC-type glycerol-3-phosphate transport system substrate-binding protein
MKKLCALICLLLLTFSSSVVFAGGKQESEPAAKKPVSIRVWFTTRQPIVDMTQKYIEKFTTENPWAKVDFLTVKEADMLAKFTTAHMAGNQPDVTYIDEIIFDAMVNADQLKPLPVDEAWVVKKMGKDVAERFKVKGSYYVLPNGNMTSLLFYNTDHLKKAGVDAGSIPKKWDDFVPFAGKVAGANGLKTSLAFNGTAHNFAEAVAYQLGGTSFLDSETCVYGSEQWVQAAQFVMDLFDKYKTDSRDNVQSREAFGTGKAPFVYEWSWFIGMMQGTYKDINFETRALPTPNGTPPHGRYGDNAGFSVTYTDEKKKEAAELFWKMLMTTEFQKEFAPLRGLVSANLEVRESELYAAQPFITAKELISKGLAVNDGDPPSEVTTFRNRAWSAIQDGGADIRTALKEAEKETNRVLAKMDNWLLWGKKGRM